MTETAAPICVKQWCRKPILKDDPQATTNKAGYPVCGSCTLKAKARKRGKQ